MQPPTGIIPFTALPLATLLGLLGQGQSEKITTPYPGTAPIDRYLIPDAAAEISLAKSATPGSISHGAEV